MNKAIVLILIGALQAAVCLAESPVQGLEGGLGDLFMLSNAKTRSISAENPNGEVAGGAKEEPAETSASGWLGKGWKVRPCITLGKGETVTLANIQGPGIIQHIWMTAAEPSYRNCVLRFYWDDETNPSVEVPFGDFFAVGHGVRYNVNSIPVAVNPKGGFNCYWPMPFRKSCKVTIENQYWEDIKSFFYQITYALTEVPEQAAYFHAQWRRTYLTDVNKPEHILLDNVKGQGHYVGTFVGWTQLSNGWWGEGELKFFIDGDQEYPTICGTGTEDYFGGAWGFKDTFSTAYLGYPYWEKEAGKVPKHALYRWHILDPIRFGKDLKVTVQALGWYPNHKFRPLTDDICSTAYWYQSEPHGAFPALPTPEFRWPR